MGRGFNDLVARIPRPLQDIPTGLSQVSLPQLPICGSS
jgi:hypothetical protein